MTVSEFNKEMAIERSCGECPMFGRGTFVGCDSYNGLTGPATVLFMGLNPGQEEARQGLPFVGISGKFLRENLYEIFGDKVSWAMINSLLCSSSNETEIIGANQARKSCRVNVARFWQKFHPLIIVPCGNGAMSLFEIQDGITKASEKTYLSRGRAGRGDLTVIMPLIHPSALIRSGGRSSPKWIKWRERLESIFSLARQSVLAPDMETFIARNYPGLQYLFNYKNDM